MGDPSVMQNTRDAMALLEELNELGARLVLDDFGTGFSSLSISSGCRCMR